MNSKHIIAASILAAFAAAPAWATQPLHQLIERRLARELNSQKKEQA